jgi:hypothetical protein
MRTVNFSNVPMELLTLEEAMLFQNTSDPVDTWLMDTFFPRRPSFSTSNVAIADMRIGNAVAPFVAPCNEAQPIDYSANGNVEYVPAAYLKPSRTITPCTVHDEAVVQSLLQAGLIGGGSFGQLTPQDELRISQVEAVRFIEDSLKNREILMCRDLLINGKTTYVSSKHPEVLVDYNRDANCSFSPAIPWSDPTAKPVQDIQQMIQLSILHGKSYPNIALTTSAVWEALIKHNDFNDLFVKPYTGINVPFTNDFQFGDSRQAQYVGNLPGGRTQVWIYDAVLNIDGQNDERFIPEDFFALISDTNGLVGTCPIEHLGAYKSRVPMYWYEEVSVNPSMLEMICDASRIVAPGNRNGVIGGTGFVA